MDIAAAYYKMAKITLSSSSVRQGMDALLDYILQVHPDNNWDRLRRLDYTGEGLALRQWLESVLREEPPGSDVRAYWFGIFNPVIGEQASCAFYISGPTENYTPQTQNWACWTNETYLPEHRYAHSPVLASLYQASQEVVGAGLLGEYVLCLGYVCLTVAELIRSLEPHLFLGSTKQRSVVVGFDDGDDLLLGTIGSNGLFLAAPPVSV